MALKPSQGIAAKLDNATRSPAAPILYEVELKEHRRVPSVMARLKRVQRLVDARAQQKV
jgi:hypothetical protein